MAANIISALLTTMLVKVNDPVSHNFIEWGIFPGLMTSSGHAYLRRHTVYSFVSGIPRMS